MDADFVYKLHFSFRNQIVEYPYPKPVVDAYNLITSFYQNTQSNNKLCIVLPARESMSHWLAIPITLSCIMGDYLEHSSDIFNSHKKYKRGDKLIINDSAVVEWERYDGNSIYFYTNETISKKVDPTRALIKIPIKYIKRIKPAPPKKDLSSFKKVRAAYRSDKSYPIDILLDIETEGNSAFQRSKVCLITKYSKFEVAVDNLNINNARCDDYFKIGRIDDNGIDASNSTLLLSNNISKLVLHSQTLASKYIIIDGFSSVQDRLTDFIDLDSMNIPTILVTDLSEIESFETLRNYGYEFFNFTDEHLSCSIISNSSPFYSFDAKINNFLSCNVVVDICKEDQVELLNEKLSKVRIDESNHDQSTIIFSLIKISNYLSRISHIPTIEEVHSIRSSISIAENHFNRTRMWLGDYHVQIGECIELVKDVLEKFANEPSDKSQKLNQLIYESNFDFIICATEDEALSLAKSLSIHQYFPRIISISDVNDTLLTNKGNKAILTGWMKSSNFNKLLSSFVFSELRLLFYDYEIKYYKSLLKRNQFQSNNLKSTIDVDGVRHLADSTLHKTFGDFFANRDFHNKINGVEFDVMELEYKLDNAQYSHYQSSNNSVDAIRAKRIVFDSGHFIHAAESHKFYDITDLIVSGGKHATINRFKVDALQQGDIIAFINTDRDILVELVDQLTKDPSLSAIKYWTRLWRTLLIRHYVESNYNFSTLVNELRYNGCTKHEATIRSWLFDEGKIGPNDDSDLINIALMTNSKELLDNITTVREAIKKMTGWRMRAADVITERIKKKIHELASSSTIGDSITIDGLGTVNVLKVNEISNTWLIIDARYVNKLLRLDLD